MPQTLERNIRAFIARGSGLDSTYVIPGNERGPRPQEPYASLLHIPPDTRHGYPIRVQLPNNATRSVQHRRASYSLQFYRKGAENLALAFSNYAESENGLTDAEDNSIRVVFPLSLSRLDGIVGDAFEERVVVDLSVDYVHITDQDTGVIDVFDGTVDYGGIVTDIMHS